MIKRRRFLEVSSLASISILTDIRRKYSAQTSIRNKLNQAMIDIPQGDFIVGADEGMNLWQPKHRMWLPSFRIMKSKVTWGDWFQFAKLYELTIPNRPRQGEPIWGNDEDVRLVNFRDAEAFADWVGFHIPTEFEWERAARGIGGQKYSWGDEWDHTQYGFTNSDDWDQSPAGMIQICSQMRGEWTSSFPAPYPNQLPDSALRMQYQLCGHTHRVIRGGVGVKTYGVYSRSWMEETEVSAMLGFRLVERKQTI